MYVNPDTGAYLGDASDAAQATQAAGARAVSEMPGPPELPSEWTVTGEAEAAAQASQPLPTWAKYALGAAALGVGWYAYKKWM